LRRGRRRQSKKLYAAGYLQSPQREGLKRHAVLAVCNIVGAVGLLGLISYGFFSDRLQHSGKSDAGIGQAAAVEFSIEDTRAPAEAGVGPLAVASLAPRLGTGEGHGPEQAAPVTGAMAGAHATHGAAPLVAAELRSSLADDFGGAGLGHGDPAPGGEVRRIVIGGEEMARPAEAPVRLASIGSVNDVLALKGSGATSGADLSFGSLFREPGRRLRGPAYDAIPAPTQVPLVRRNETSAVLVLSFAEPPFQVRDIDPETRGDLVEIEEIARKAIAEGDSARDRRLARERFCLAAAIYYEARGEPLDGQQAVAQVVLNRVADARYPGTVCGVVFQDENRRHRCQFSFACDGRPERPRPGVAWTRSLDIAREFLNGFAYTPVAAATHYHADYVAPVWSRSREMTRVGKIGNHIFYNES